MEVAGIDGCRTGWVVVTTGTAPGAPITATVERELAPVIDRLRRGELAAIGLDMPIGLPTAGGRASDAAARARLGPRRSSLFPTPPRGVLDATDYADALSRCRAVSGRGLSRQAFNLVPKMREVAAAVAPDLQPALCEVHPETSFAALAGRPCRFPKRTADGAAERLALLTAHFDGIDTTARRVPSGARLDDLLDACAAAWTARRVARDEAEWLGDPHARDERGLHLTIAV